MDFTVLNVTETRLSFKWDLLIRIPDRLPGHYTLQPSWAKLLKVSSIALEGDTDDLIVKDVMDNIKEKGETWFGARLLLPDCREGTSGKMMYACDEATFRFEHGSKKAFAFGNQPTCAIVTN
ncbi:unnamed protein product [Microthlaspi erraticum]|uniref:Uncharacterized protein n=1 Tax=Microthlaspi erraticum TaxID=1685480 RepID=A0A6D2IN85_9BRAS|nr:unnamed protein product [Microthlaspi erraticum]